MPDSVRYCCLGESSYRKASDARRLRTRRNAANIATTEAMELALINNHALLPEKKEDFPKVKAYVSRPTLWSSLHRRVLWTALMSSLTIRMSQLVIFSRMTEKVCLRLRRMGSNVPTCRRDDGAA
jgi:hypothetical protein